LLDFDPFQKDGFFAFWKDAIGDEMEGKENDGKAMLWQGSKAMPFDRI
jgi:hypothetical protein